MSIFPSTDLVVDVARAADPRRYAVAVKRLDAIATTDPAAARAFATLVDAAPHAQPKSLQPVSTVARREPTPTPAAQAAQKLEAFVMQSWLEVLLPKEESGAFGTGAGAGIWRSMMAEQLGAQLAKTGALGLHKTLTASVGATASTRQRG